MLTRRGLLLVTGAGVLASAAPTFAAAPKPTPQADDAGFLAFLVAGESVAADLYGRAALSQRDWFAASERRRLVAIGHAKRGAIVRLSDALGDDAPSDGDFGSSFPKADLASRARLLALAERLERLLCGVGINGVAYTIDPATRLLLGRLLAADTQALSAVRLLAGKPATTGLLAPIALDAAGNTLDEFLTTPTAPVTT